MSKTPLLLLALVALTGLFYFGQKTPVIETEGLYPVVRARDGFFFKFGPESIEVTLRDRVPTERLAVFAYDIEGRPFYATIDGKGKAITSIFA